MLDLSQPESPVSIAYQTIIDRPLLVLFVALLALLLLGIVALWRAGAVKGGLSGNGPYLAWNADTGNEIADFIARYREYYESAFVLVGLSIALALFNVNPVWILLLNGFALWWAIVRFLGRTGWLKRLNITAYGPLIMWRTFRGHGLLDALATPKGFWKVLMTVCIPMVFVSMALMLLIVVVTDVMMIVRTPAPSQINAPQNILAIPGVNQFVPLVWGWIALIVAMVVHEFGHAIMAKAEQIKVKSLGLLLIPIPLGAFAEIDEEEMFGTRTEGGAGEILGPLDTKAAGAGARKASSMGQIRILSAGVISNFLVAILAFALLFGPVLGAIAATNSDMVVVNVAPGTPAHDAGVQKNMIITAVDGVNVTSPDQLNGYLKSREGGDVTLSGVQGDKAVSHRVHVSESRGIYVLGVVEGYPAQKAGIGPNMHLVSINGTPISSNKEYAAYMANTTPGQVVTVGVISANGTLVSYTLTLTSGIEPKGYMGFGAADLSDNPLGIMVGPFDAQERLATLQGLLKPEGDTILAKALSLVGGLLIVWIIPIWDVIGGPIGFTVFQSDLASLFYPTGWATPLGSGIFYVALSLFWIGWLNANIALFNCLPMIPLDGGHIFREFTRVSVGSFIGDREKVERISKAIVNGFTITLVSSLVFMIVAPYIVHGFV